MKMGKISIERNRRLVYMKKIMMSKMSDSTVKRKTIGLTPETVLSAGLVYGN